jgi:hypothetical protein
MTTERWSAMLWQSLPEEFRLRQDWDQVFL